MAAAASCFLYPVKCSVGVLENIAFRILPVPERYAHAERSRGKIIPGLLQHDVCLFDLSFDLFPDGTVHIGHDHYELISTEPEYHGTQGRSKCTAQLDAVCERRI